MHILTTAVLLFLFSAILLGFSGICGQAALDKWNEWRAFETYQYKHFNRERVGPDSNSGEAKEFLNGLDVAKRRADESLRQISSGHNMPRLKEVNDYTFKIFRDIWFAQKKWIMANGRYFQGSITMPNPPRNLENKSVFHRYGLTDQVDDWLDIGYADEYAPVQLECHVYDGPSGQGFTVWAKFAYKGAVWVNQMHVGPERSRNDSNYVWKNTIKPGILPS